MSDRAGWLYILHFTDPLHHARHYTGSTTHVERRIEQHEAGKGSSITRHLARLGLGWHIAGLYQCEDCRKVEAWIKRQKDAAKWCPICNQDGPGIPEAIQIPIPERLQHEHKHTT